MRIDHIAIWANDIEALRRFYTSYFGLRCGDRYTNAAKGFTSYFLSSDDGGARIELMHAPSKGTPASRGQQLGLAHISMSVGSREQVNALTERLRGDGHAILGEPRTTGDGYYESVVADPEGNWVEITE